MVQYKYILGVEGGKVLLAVEDFVIKPTCRDWIIKIKGRPFKKFHGHRNTKQECEYIRDCILNNILPDYADEIECCRRLLEEDEFKKLRGKHRKAHYNNNSGKGKGVKH